MSLIEYLQQVPDFRTQPRYPLWVLLLLIIMGVMSGCQGYRALEDFVLRHQQVLLELLDLPHKRLPSYSTLRRAMVRINFRAFTEVFNAWAKDTFERSPHSSIAADGKSIKASVRDYADSCQDFISIVSAFSVEQGVVVSLEPMHQQQQSELVTVQILLEQLGLRGACLTLDALHCQKKPLSKSLRVATTTS